MKKSLRCPLKPSRKKMREDLKAWQEAGAWVAGASVPDKAPNHREHRARKNAFATGFVAEKKRWKNVVRIY